MGAVPLQLATAVMREGVMLTLIGLAVGLPAALLAARVMRSLLFGIPATDAWTFGVVAIFFLVFATLAGVMPARRAAKVDPVIALRAD